MFNWYKKKKEKEQELERLSYVFMTKGRKIVKNCAEELYQECKNDIEKVKENHFFYKAYLKAMNPNQFLNVTNSVGFTNYVYVRFKTELDPLLNKAITLQSHLSYRYASQSAILEDICSYFVSCFSEERDEILIKQLEKEIKGI